MFQTEYILQKAHAPPQFQSPIFSLSMQRSYSFPSSHLVDVHCSWNADVSHPLLNIFQGFFSLISVLFCNLSHDFSVCLQINGNAVLVISVNIIRTSSDNDAIFLFCQLFYKINIAVSICRSIAHRNTVKKTVDWFSILKVGIFIADVSLFCFFHKSLFLSNISRFSFCQSLCHFMSATSTLSSNCYFHNDRPALSLCFILKHSFVS